MPAAAAVAQPETRSVVSDDPWKRLPFKSEAERERTKKLYLEKTGAKALVVTDTGQNFWSNFIDTTVSEAEASKLTLQQCEFYYLRPCYTAVIGTKVLDPGPVGFKAVSVMGAILADDVKVSTTEPPFVPPSLRLKFRAYKTLKGHRAAAINYWSHLAWETSSKSSEDAQQKALKACQDTVAKWQANAYGTKAPPCFLYAIDDRIVLKDRLLEPVKVAVSSPVAAVALPKNAAPTPSLTPKAAPQASTIVPRPFKADDVKFVQPKFISDMRALEGLTRNWALATESTTEKKAWFSAAEFGQSVETLESLALQRCEFLSTQKCFIYARNGQVVANENAPARRPVLIERGALNLDHLPFVLPDAKSKYAYYARLNGNKAMAIHPDGTVVGRSIGDAVSSQKAALDACNDETKKRWGISCYVYAINNDVVMHRRATTPIP